MVAATNSLSKEDKRAKFEAVFPILVDEIVDYLTSVNVPQDAKDWFKKSLYHNTLGGKYNRGLSVIDTYEILSGKALDDNSYFRAALLGWCIELLQAFFLVADDMMDESKTRRGQPCWYLMPNVGSIAINDSFMLESAIYFLLKKHFRHETYYVDLLDLFHEVTFQTTLGQELDLLTAPENHVDLSKFSQDKHAFIVIFKTAYYSFYLPVALAMCMANVATPDNLQRASDVLIPLGKYFQIQDDYLDCYGDPSVTGKVGTDILDNKCSWLINVALAKASPEQRKVLDENYGRKDADCEKRVKAVFEELNLKKAYEEYEESEVSTIKQRISVLDESAGLKKEAFTTFLNKIYKRSK
ncbi:geranyltranstransferase Fps1 [Schizosaccharomyces japonicus yFS275]|uniref:Geranyltranstransferase Fps1 n=1 Tax=Schizosaccharomyces japonicus (strain yFS275 / FY16936) TaxID=402676 RepID=B6K405_SCHJY|nr:geranyltranstransferase Fps1 [Schizosaccharomyces japonicus yFS275]EEB08212.1 geranyltranstransferase Fps1 [Schizosaccharomyces japonicus yFS275]